jgi:hypothetical protein
VSTNTTLKQRSFISPSVLFLDDSGYRNVQVKDKRGVEERVVELIEDSCNIASPHLVADTIQRPKSHHHKPSDDSALSSDIQQEYVQSSTNSNTDGAVLHEEKCQVTRVSPPAYHDVMQKQGVYDVTV